MAFHVSSERVDKHVRTLARITGQSITDAIDDAVQEKIQRIRPRKIDKDYVRDLMRLTDQMASSLKPDKRSPDDLVGYDDAGLWN